MSAGRGCPLRLRGTRRGTTAYDVERQFGVADEHAPDGALVYHFHAAGRDPGRDDRTEAVTLRFERGVLSKICRARS
jgi:hypothetical protein